MLTAVTGGIAVGKSTVLGYLAESGCKTASADAFAREIFVDPEVNRLLAEAIGSNAPVTPNELRRALAESTGVRREVNRIMHPRVMSRIENSDAEFVEIPLLFEACLQARFDAIWLVTCGEVEQLRRLSERYGPDFDGKALMSAQLRTMVKIPFADEVLRTNCSLEAVSRHVSEALARRFEWR